MRPRVVRKTITDFSYNLSYVCTMDQKRKELDMLLKTLEVAETNNITRSARRRVGGQEPTQSCMNKRWSRFEAGS